MIDIIGATRGDGIAGVDLGRANRELAGRDPLDVIRWAIDLVPGRAVVSTNFRPYEVVLLHLVTRVWPQIPVLWVDHGYNRPATYHHAARLVEILGLNLRVYAPRMTVARYEALHGSPPDPGAGDEGRLREFSTAMKLEPFRRGMRELAPAVWITGLREVQNPGRAGLDIVAPDPNFGAVKVNPLFRWVDAALDAYRERHGLPEEWDYFDPAKGDERRECGLHAGWGGAVADGPGESAGEGR